MLNLRRIWNRVGPSVACLVLATSSCRTLDLEAGATTVVTRGYPLTVEQAWRVARTSAQTLDFKVTSDRHDAIRGELVALRATGEEVQILMKAKDSNNTEVAVQVGPGDIDMATLLQERMAEHAGMGQGKTGLFGGDSLDGVYCVTLTDCLQAGRRSFRELRVALKHQESHDTWGAVDGLQGDSTPVRIKGQNLGEMRTRVLFTVGTRSSEDHKAFVRTLKETFERQISLPASTRDD
jgi:hypothetical protein